MLKPFFEYIFYMAVGERIIDDFALLFIFDEIGKPQRFELMGYGGFRHVQQDGQIAHAHFIAVKRPKYPQPRIVGKHLVQTGKVVKILFRRHHGLYFVHNFAVDDLAVAHNLFIFGHISDGFLCAHDALFDKNIAAFRRIRSHNHAKSPPGEFIESEPFHKFEF